MNQKFHSLNRDVPSQPSKKRESKIVESSSSESEVEMSAESDSDLNCSDHFYDSDQMHDRMRTRKITSKELRIHIRKKMITNLKILSWSL